MRALRTALLAALALALASAPATAGDGTPPPGTKPPAGRMNFVGCPVIRDNAEVPCWLAEYQGELYYIGIQNDITATFHPPQLKHRALVEGMVSKKPRICGGIVLEPVNVSVIPEVDTRCNKILPAQGYRIDNAPRGTGPASRGMQAASDPNPPPPAPPPPPPAPPFAPRDVAVRFGFDGLYMNFHNFKIVQDTAAYVRASGARKIRIEGHRGATLLSNGRTLVETAGLARQRADKVAEALRGLGVAPASLEVAASEVIETPDGVADFERRRVRIVVTP